MPNTEDHSSATDRRLLQLAPSDNVLTVIATLEPGESVCVGSRRVIIASRLPLGHKLAARDLAPGDKIIKYGVPIGSAVVHIAAGEHVHTHNIKSDYLPTFTREDQGKYFKDHH